MNKKLSAGPTLEDLENTDTETNNSTDSESNNSPSNTQSQASETLTWHCPYCDFSHTELGDLRNHITSTIEGDHEGVSGWSPTRDIIATNDNDDVVRRIEGAGERPDEDHHLEHGEKQKLIINAWLELDKERDIQAITNILPVSEEYVRRLTKQLEDGEITTEEYREELDWDVRDELSDRLETYHETQTQATDTTDMTQTTLDTQDQEHGAKKKQIINAWLLDNNISPSTLDDIFSSSYEYIRREIKKLKDGEISQAEIDDATDENLQEQIRSELESIGVEIDTDATESDTESEQGEQTDLVDIDLDADDPFENVDASKREILVNIILHDTELSNAKAADLAGASTEYARQTYNGIQDGEYDPEQYQNDAIQNSLQELDVSGDLAEFFAEDDADSAEEATEATTDTTIETTTTTDTTGTTDTIATTDTTDTTHTPGTDEEHMIPASELEDIRDTAELLLKQAEYEADAGNQNAKAEFIAKRLRDDLDELLETA